MSLSMIGFGLACFIVGAIVGLALFVRGLAAAFKGFKIFR